MASVAQSLWKQARQGSSSTNRAHDHAGSESSGGEDWKNVPESLRPSLNRSWSEFAWRWGEAATETRNARR